MIPWASTSPLDCNQVLNIATQYSTLHNSQGTSCFKHARLTVLMMHPMKRRVTATEPVYEPFVQDDETNYLITPIASNLPIVDELDLRLSELIALRSGVSLDYWI